MCVAPKDGLSPLSQISSEEWQRDTPEGSQGWTVLLCPKFPVRNARGTPVCSALLGAQLECWIGVWESDIGIWAPWAHHSQQDESLTGRTTPQFHFLLFPHTSPELSLLHLPPETEFPRKKTQMEKPECKPPQKIPLLLLFILLPQNSSGSSDS